MSRRKKKKKSKLINNILLSVLVLLIGLILVEVYLQISFETQYVRGRVFNFSERLGWENIPDIHKMAYSKYYKDNINYIHNSIGLRDEREFSIEQTNPRILLIGDSFVYGDGIDQADIIGRRLQELLPEYEIITAGTIGYSTTQYLMWYEEALHEYKPEIVVFFVYVNDFAENRQHKAFGFTKPWIYFTPEFDIAEFDNIAEYEKRWGTVSMNMKQEQKGRYFPMFFFDLYQGIKDNINELKTESYEESFLRINQGHIFLEQSLPIPAREDLILEDKLLRHAKEVIEKDGAKFFVAFLPTRVQVDEVYREEVFKRYYNIDQYNFSFPVISKYMKRVMGEAEIPLLDYYHIFIDHKDTSSLFVPDGHLSPDGTKVVDEELHKALIEQGFIE